MTDEQKPMDVNPEPSSGQPFEPANPADAPDLFSPPPVDASPEPYSTPVEPVQPVTPSFNPPPAGPYIPPQTYNAPVTPPPTPPAKKGGMAWWVILIIVLVVLCCCCVVVGGAYYLYMNGDSIFNTGQTSFLLAQSVL